MYQNLQKTKGLVENVFNQVFNKYDLMNDLMSFGAHRVWKKDLIFMMNPSIHKRLIDVGCGTGDIAKLFSEITKRKNDVLNVDPNIKMINEGKKKIKKLY